MSKNIYDIFRDVQDKRKDCYDNRSAAFIIDGQMAQIVYHKRLKKEISAALVFGHKEGPDDILVYTLSSDDLIKSDYFIWKGLNFLVYEEQRMTDTDLPYKKQNALECNVSFNFNGEPFIGYFKSALRGSESPTMLGKKVVIPEESPLLVLPTNNKITIKSEFMIEGKPFVVKEYDHITNKGITYYYLERGTEKTIAPVVPVDPAVPPVDPVVPPVIDNTPKLYAMMEYEFNTQGAIFAATPAVEIISRSLSKVKFRIPFGITSIVITTKENGVNIEKLYNVEAM